jgi:hypothetical protein
MRLRLIRPQFHVVVGRSPSGRTSADRIGIRAGVPAAGGLPQLPARW